MINLLQEYIEMESPRTNSTFAITHELFILRVKVFVNVPHFAQANAQTENCKRAIFLSTHKNNVFL